MSGEVSTNYFVWRGLPQCNPDQDCEQAQVADAKPSKPVKSQFAPTQPTPQELAQFDAQQKAQLKLQMAYASKQARQAEANKMPLWENALVSLAAGATWPVWVPLAVTACAPSPECTAGSSAFGVNANSVNSVPKTIDYEKQAGPYDVKYFTTIDPSDSNKNIPLQMFNACAGKADLTLMCTWESQQEPVEIPLTVTSTDKDGKQWYQADLSHTYNTRPEQQVNCNLWLEGNNNPVPITAYNPAAPADGTTILGQCDYSHGAPTINSFAATDVDGKPINKLAVGDTIAKLSVIADPCDPSVAVSVDFVQGNVITPATQSEPVLNGKGETIGTRYFVLDYNVTNTTKIVANATSPVTATDGTVTSKTVNVELPVNISDVSGNYQCIVPNFPDAITVTSEENKTGKAVTIDFAATLTADNGDITPVTNPVVKWFVQAPAQALGKPIDGDPITGALVDYPFQYPAGKTGVQFYFVTAQLLSDKGAVICFAPSYNNKIEIRLATSTPVSNMQVSPSAAVKMGAQVRFDAQNSYGTGGATLTDFKWDFGDGSTCPSTFADPNTDCSDPQVVTHSFSKAGNPKVVLTITDSNGNTDTSTTNMTIY